MSFQLNPPWWAKQKVATEEEEEALIAKIDSSFKLYNDVHFRPEHDSSSKSSTTWDSWAYFPHLPLELRHHIWLLFLKQHRLIELSVLHDEDEEWGDYPNGPEDSDGPEDPNKVKSSSYYTDRNQLGNLISGRGYTLEIETPQSGGSCAGPPPLSPLLSVNKEARDVALEFYRVRLPFPRPDGPQTLYLNPEHDVIYIQPRDWVRSLLPDFLHDVKAYDPKGQGVEHLALHHTDLTPDDFLRPLTEPIVKPERTHPTAASSFADILRSTLRSVFLVTPFHTHMRGATDLQWPLKHFGQTFPLRRRGFPTGAFEWFETDPRQGIELDLEQVPLGAYMVNTVVQWEMIEKAFGVERRRRTLGRGMETGADAITEGDEEDDDADDNDDDDDDHADADAEEQADDGDDEDGEDANDDDARSRADREEDMEEEDDDTLPRLFICPSMNWGQHELEERLDRLRPDKPPGPPIGSREELAQHLRVEARNWQSGRWFWSQPPMSWPPIPRSGVKVDAETFEAMERACSTAVGWWVLPAAAFSKPTRPNANSFDLREAARPGLFLFEV